MKLDQLVVVSAHAQRPVLSVHQVDGGVHDGAQGFVELEAGRDHQHGFNKTVRAIAALDDLLDAVLDLHEEFAQT
jgi:hypothetical protein